MINKNRSTYHVQKFLLLIALSISCIYSSCNTNKFFDWPANYFSNETTKNYSLAFVYLGDILPSYLEYSILQARLFNKFCPIFLLIDESAFNKNEELLRKINNLQVAIVNCKTLKKSLPHREFEVVCSEHSITDHWKFRIERFFYIDELMHTYHLKDVFQVECDVMIYANLEHYMDTLHEFQTQIACPFENDYIASTSLVYFSDTASIKKYIRFMTSKIQGQFVENDMYLLASYENEVATGTVEHLPTITKDYIRKTVLQNQKGEIASRPWKYWNHIEEWNSIFDNDGIGSFLDIERWIYPKSFFDPSLYDFTWKRDTEGRLVPYASSEYGLTQYTYRINTLHIAKKNLQKFLSV